jgi:serine/threonine protein kinase
MREGTETPVQVGDVIAGKYRVERVLGRGAMGMVVAAMHLTLLELRAIKFMLPQALTDVQAVERFLREMRATVGLKSIHVAKVYDAGRLPTGAPYIVMEYLEGIDLGRMVRRYGPLSVPDALRYMLQACEAIGEAHAAGVIHRDLKPANLYLTTGAGGQPCIKVLDFGIAKLAPLISTRDNELTTTTEIIGTPSYMSPEQMRAHRTTDLRTDVWSLGATLYKLLTGQVPFAGQTIPEVGSSVLRDSPVPPSTLRPAIPKGLSDVILGCLEKERALRFASIAELAQALSAFTDEPARVVSAGASVSVVSAASGAASADRVSVSPISLRSFALGPEGRESVGSVTSPWSQWIPVRLRQRARSFALFGGAVSLLLVGLVVGSLLSARPSRVGVSAAETLAVEAAPTSASTAEALWSASTPEPSAAPGLVFPPATACAPPAEVALAPAPAPAPPASAAAGMGSPEAPSAVKGSTRPRTSTRRSPSPPAKIDGRGGDGFGFSRK